MKKSIFSALCLVLLATTTQSAWGQSVSVGDILWSEPFKGTNTSTTFKATSTWSSYVNPTTFVAADKTALQYSSQNAMLTSSTATNMTDAHVWLNKSTTGYIQVDNIPLYNATEVTVGWSQAGSKNVTVSYAFDGNTSFATLSTNASATASYTSAKLDVSSHTTISLKFTRASNTTNVRLDNLVLTATAVSGSTPTTLYLGQEMELFWNPARRFAVFGTPPVALLLVPFKRGQCFFLRAEAILLCGLPFLRGVPVGRRVWNFNFVRKTSRFLGPHPSLRSSSPWKGDSAFFLR